MHLLGYMNCTLFALQLLHSKLLFRITLVMILSVKMPPYGYNAYPLMMTMAGRNGKTLRQLA
jgi:hypothetical protein